LNFSVPVPVHQPGQEVRSAATTGNSHFFASLSSPRRLALLGELNTLLCGKMRSCLPDRLAALPGIEDFDIYAGDGHFHRSAAHDPRDENDRKQPVGHLYSRCLRTGALRHLTAMDDVLNKKEHDMHALKRIEIKALRHEAKTGRKVLIVYDRAVINYDQWHQWKQGSGIYVLTRTKENLVFELVRSLDFDCSDPINAGVLADELVKPSSGKAVTLRRITFKDIVSGEVYEYLTNVLSEQISPGVLAFLYRSRWGIEKSFDEFKNHLGEQKAWATSATAKCMQAQFLCITMNLFLLMEHQLATEEGIRNEPEEKRRAQRLDKAQQEAKKHNTILPKALFLVTAMSQVGVKLIRWVSANWVLKVPWKQACMALVKLYAAL